MDNLDKKGHRERLKNSFLNGDSNAVADEALIELLLTYAIPIKDVQPLAKNLIDRFGDLEGILSASIDVLCENEGIKAHSAILIKLADWIRRHYIKNASKKEPKIAGSLVLEEKQETLFKTDRIKLQPPPLSTSLKPPLKKEKTARRGTGLFGKAVLKEAIEQLPNIPEVASVEEIRTFLRKNLHFNAEETRRRYADYIAYRMFPDGVADNEILTFAKHYKNRQELRDVCFYRFCKVESIMLEVVRDLLIPSIGRGHVSRSDIRSYIQNRFPTSKSITDSTKAIIDALSAGGIVKSDRKEIAFSYREILLPSFVFILHSEFSEPTMYDISKLETNAAIRSMFWNPDRILPALYELRNMGIIAKISEIDNMRQFTTKWTLSQAVDNLCKSEKT